MICYLEYFVDNFLTNFLQGYALNKDYCIRTTTILQHDTRYISGLFKIGRYEHRNRARALISNILN